MNKTQANFNANNLAVVLIDMQDFFLKHFKPEIVKTLVINQSKVIDLCIKNKVPIIVLEYKCKGVFRGETIIELRRKIKNVSETLIVIKESNGGFTNTDLDKILKNIKCKKILLMGINANGCVQDTAISALHKGYVVMTSKGIIASAHRNDMELSKRNEAWYKENTIFFEDTKDLINHFSK